MSNITKVELQQSIITLHEQGWSERRISRELGVHRGTVKRYVSDSKCTNPQTGKQGPVSSCESYRDRIKEWFESGLSIERIHHDLTLAHGFDGSYHSVYRFVQSLDVDKAKRVYRMECEPGQEAQIDYGTLYLPIGDEGRRKKVHVLLVTLSHSRKSYVEAVLSQSSESFLRSLENALRHFGGVPERLCPDNLKAAVIKADWYEPELNPKLRDFAAHYGTVILPSRPYTPTDKGKVEAGVKYVKNNALKGKSFTSLAEVNEHLRWWTANVADKRIHGTTKRQVGTHFEQAEKAALKPLPDSLFPCYEEGHRSVHRDSYVEVKGAYYEVPAQYIGKQVWVRWDAAMVRVFDAKIEKIAVHTRLEKGQYTEVLGAGGCRGGVVQSTNYFRGKVIPMGEHTVAWADSMIASDKDRALRRLQGLLSFKGKYTPARINEAARKACIHGQYTLRDLRRWLESPQEQETFSFLQQHELIRNPHSYDSLAKTGDLFN
jgi:transposase